MRSGGQGPPKLKRALYHRARAKAIPSASNPWGKG